MTDLNNYFQDYLKKRPLFLNKKALQLGYTPNKIYHRENQIDIIAGILAPSLRMEKPSNLFLYGKTGTGKTLVAKYVTEQIMQVAKEKDLPLSVVYLNCKLKRVVDTEYRLIVQLAKEFGQEIPATGLPTDEVYRLFLNNLDQEKRMVIMVLDEVDQLVRKTGDEVLYNLTRIGSELKNVDLCVLGISNDLLFLDNIDPRVKSSLSEEELVFAPYNALQLQDILRQRSEACFSEGVISPGLIEKCAAYAAREHGDARRALELLRVAGEIAERKNKQKIEIEDLDEAEDKIERDKVLDMIHTQPKQFQVTILSIFDITEIITNKPIFTGDVYEVYKELCSKLKLKPLTQRRVSDIIAELDMLGLINAKVISKGRYGRTREIKLAIPPSMVPNTKHALKEGLNL